MPTGYTHGVGDGSITTFRDFALLCARAFGATIMMRDEPMDAPIPEKFEADTEYRDSRISEAKAELERLIGMTDEECESAALAEFEQTVRERQQAAAEREEQRLRYKRMLEKVRAWKPPSDDHKEMKSFMEKQLVESIDFDCGHYGSEPERETGAEWRDRRMNKASRDITYHEDERRGEVERAERRTQWISALRQSLNGA